ncbi:MAG: MurT ligase domain-containing protein [Acutalibacteraceae bacterium]
MRKMLAIGATKFLIWLGQAMNKQGSSTPGKIGLKIYPNLLKDLAAQVREDIFVVCGTNGKTTTNNLLCEALRSEGKKVVCNSAGANMLYGIVTAFADSASISGKLNADCACIEIDEASARRAFPHFKPNYMVLTNLFRDQLDRYGEIDITMDVLKEALAMSPNTKLIVNGDDPLSVALAKHSGNPFVTFGVDEQVIDAKHAAKEMKEGRFCQMCGAELQYDYYHYSQLGKYHCPKCDFARPKLDYAVTNVHLDRGISLRMEGRQFRIKSHGFYNVYNILAAYAAARTAGFYLERFDQVLRRHKTQNGRMELFDIGGRHVVLNLAKNPAGFNQNISAVLEDKSPKDLIVVINDKAQDGKDISWLWDVDFERFHDARVQTFIASGIRALDMQLRFKYADIPSKVEEDVTKAIERLVTGGTGNLYVLCNYTALYNTHLILKKLEEGKV